MRNRTYQNMSDRQAKIFIQLVESIEPVSSESLSKILATSSKTIKKDITDLSKILETAGARIEGKTGVGYWIEVYDNHLYREYLKVFETTEATEVPIQVQRAHYIIRSLLINETSRIKVQDFEELLYISRSTINDCMKILRDILPDYELELIHKQGHGLYIQGSEYRKRQCLLDEIYYYENSSLFIDEDEFFDFSDSTRDDYKQIEVWIGKAHSLFESFEISMNNMKLIIAALSVCQIRNHINMVLPYDEKEIDALNSKTSHKIATYLIEMCENSLGYRFGSGDRLFLTIYITCLRNYSDLNYMENEEVMSDYVQLATEIQSYVAEYYKFNYLSTDNYLKSTLALHLLTMVKRLRYGVTGEILPIKKIKRQSPTSMTLAITASQYIMEILKIHMSENEICYLSIIFFPYFGRYVQIASKKNIVIVSSINKNFAMIIHERLKRNFHEVIESIDVLEFYELPYFDFSRTDVIFSDIEAQRFSEELRNRVIQLTPFFHTRLKHQIKDILSLTTIPLSNITQYFNKEDFYTHVDVKNQAEMFELLSKNTTAKNRADYSQELKKREQLSSGEQSNNIAFLQVKDRQNKPSKVCVYLLNKPILWKKQHVQLVILWHLDRMDDGTNELIESGIFGNILKAIFYNTDNIVNLLMYQNFDFLMHLIKERISMTNSL